MGVFEAIGNLFLIVINGLKSVPVFNWGFSLWDCLCGLFISVWAVRIIVFMFNLPSSPLRPLDDNKTSDD